MIGERNEFCNVRAGHAAFPAGDGIGRSLHERGKLLLTFISGNALLGDHLSKLLYMKVPYKSLLRFCLSAQFFHGDSECSCNFAEL